MQNEIIGGRKLLYSKIMGVRSKLRLHTMVFLYNDYANKTLYFPNYLTANNVGFWPHQRFLSLTFRPVFIVGSNFYSIFHINIKIFDSSQHHSEKSNKKNLLKWDNLHLQVKMTIEDEDKSSF